ncbi:acyl-CoA dehydrogenase family protein [Streptomyces sp. NPDC004647]|uniref:acyl-CoA dehydrogenase family protein n=1 Tax=Streptomyces sp. NPDC004647 TaxID=3154671 RepID=UPI0033B2E17B
MSAARVCGGHRAPWPDAGLIRAAAATAGRHALDADVSGSLAPETVAALAAAGFPGCFVPEPLGGAGATFGAATRAVAAIGEECAAAAWIASLWAYSGRLGAFLPAEGRAEMWAKDPQARLVSSTAGSGVRATPVAGGWLLSGAWRCAGGAESADWALLSSAAPRTGDRSVLVFAVDRDSFTHRGDSSTLGIRATGGHTLVVERAFVPEHRGFVWDDMRRGRAPGPTATAHLAPLAAVTGLAFATPILGAARGALRLAEERLAVRPRRSVARSSVRMPGRVAFARSAAEIDAAALLLFRVAETADARRFDDAPAARGRRDSTLAAEMLVGAVDRLFRAAGSQGQASSHAMQRIWRDVHAAGAHSALRFEPAAIGYAPGLRFA